MEIFIKIIGILIGLFFMFFGFELFFNSTRIIKAIQKRKYGTTAEPRNPERVMARILGGLLILAGLYYTVFAILTLL